MRYEEVLLNSYMEYLSKWAFYVSLETLGLEPKGFYRIAAH